MVVGVWCVGAGGVGVGIGIGVCAGAGGRQESKVWEREVGGAAGSMSGGRSRSEEMSDKSGMAGSGVGGWCSGMRRWGRGSLCVVWKARSQAAQRKDESEVRKTVGGAALQLVQMGGGDIVRGWNGIGWGV